MLFRSPVELVDAYGLDPVRYFLLREVPFGNDGDLQKRALVGRLNGDLANAYGNLCQRVLSIVAKSCGEKVPAKGTITEADTALLDDGVAFRAEAAAHENVLDIAQSCLAPINEILAFARSKQAASNGDLARLRTRMLNQDRKSTRLNSSHRSLSRMPSSA